MAAEVSFARADELLEALAGAPIDAKQVERTAEALGREVADDERTVTEAEPAPAPTMYLGLGGAGVPLRPSEVEGRRGKQPDGTARTREVKLAVVWTAEARDDEGRPVRDHLVRNRRRMRYPRFRARGLCVASGVVEAGCKHVVGDRLKRAGMRWTLAGANAIIALRCCQRSGRFEDFWERRAA